MADFEFWTLVTDFEFWTLEADFRFWTLVADFGFWPLGADFKFWCYIHAHKYTLFKLEIQCICRANIFEKKKS